MSSAEDVTKLMLFSATLNQSSLATTAKMSSPSPQEVNARSPKEALSRLNIDLLIPIHNTLFM